MTVSFLPAKTWRFPRLPVEDWGFVTVCAWLGLLVVSAAIAIGMANFASIAGIFGRTASDVDVTGTVWGPIMGVTVWYGAAIAGYFMHQTVPGLVAHGRTRHDSAIEATIFCVIHAVLLAALATLGFQLERGLYAIGNWDQGTPEDALYDSYGDVVPIFLDYLLRLGVWSVAGALIGAAFYRGTERGIGAVVLALLLATATGAAGGASWSPLSGVADRLSWDVNTPTAALVSIVGIAIAMVFAWVNVKDMPLRPK